jgi:two-component system, LytTR family, response regulator
MVGDRVIRAVIVDDEPPARLQVREFLAGERDVAVVAEGGDGEAALSQIRAMQPDLVFLDIRMPGMSGLDVLRSAMTTGIPYTIFTTAYSQYAVEAFSVEALDFLVKPLERRRFQEAVARARRYLKRDASLSRAVDPGVAEAFMAELELRASRRERIAIGIGRKTQILEVTTIVFVEADGDYAAIHQQNGQVLRTRESIVALEARLPRTAFARIHRSIIVNLRCVRELRTNKRGGYTLVTTTGRRLDSGSKFDADLKSLLG